jgi:hypothetical protein
MSEDITIVSSSTHPVDTSRHEITITDLLEQAEPFDLLLFKGSGIVSEVITRFQEHSLRLYERVNNVSQENVLCTHVCIVMTRELCPNFRTTYLPEDTKLIWESNYSGSLGDGVLSAETGEGFFGVQVRNLKDVLEAYLKKKGNSVALCKLINNPTRIHKEESKDQYNTRQKKQREQCIELYKKYNHERYPVNLLDLTGAALPKLRPLRDFTDNILNKMNLGSKGAIFCSEFVAIVWQAIGIMPKKYKSKDVIPQDLVSDQDFDGFVPIVQAPQWVILDA